MSTKMPNRPCKGQSGKVSNKVGIVSQIENEEEEKEEDWQKEDQMEVQWAECENLEESLERRRREGSSLLAEVMQKVPELLVHERTSQGKGVKCKEEKKTVKGRSTVEMKRKTKQLFGRRHRRNEKNGEV